MKIKKLTVGLIVLAIASGTYAAVTSSRALERSKAEAEAKLNSQFHKEEYLVATKALPAGSVVTAADMTVRTLISEGVHADALRRDDVALIDNRTILTDLTPNAPILKSQIRFDNEHSLTERIAKDERLVTIAVDALSSINGLLKPDDRVDVLFTDRSRGDLVTVPLLKDVQVVAIGAQFRRPEEQASLFNTITVACTPKDCQLLTHARNTGDISLVLSREAAQQGHYPTKTSASDLVGTPTRKRSAPKIRCVPVYGGGKRLNHCPS